MRSLPAFSWHALNSSGFRPLYALSCFWAIVSIALWVYSPQAIQGWLPALYWHVHEMLWGFVVSVAAGFLLTASANWTGKNPLYGSGLAALCILWMVTRAALLMPVNPGFYIALVASSGFYILLVVALLRVIISSANQRNFPIPLVIAGLGASDLLFLYAAGMGKYAALMHYAEGALLIMTLLTLLIGRRVIPFFTNRAIPHGSVSLQEKSGWGQIVLSVLALCCFWQNWLQLLALCLTAIACLCLWQLRAWYSGRVLAIPLLWILYLGWSGLAAGLLTYAAFSIGYLERFAWPAHTIGMAGFGLMIIGMMTRTALGHLGLALKADYAIIFMYILFIMSAALRLLALYLPEAHIPLLHSSAACWILCLLLFLGRFLPSLLSPRKDGK